MSTRDELAADLHGAGYTDANHNWRALDLADVLIAEGWRKMPSRDDVAEAVYLHTSPAMSGLFRWEDLNDYGKSKCLEAADVILALMDGGSA